MLLVTLTEKSCLIVIGDGFATAMSADLIDLATSAEKFAACLRDRPRRMWQLGLCELRLQI